MQFSTLACLLSSFTFALGQGTYAITWYDTSGCTGNVVGKQQILPSSLPYPLPIKQFILTMFNTTGSVSSEIGTAQGVVTLAQAVSVYTDFSGNNGNPAGCLWATADGETCAATDQTFNLQSCDCPGGPGCAAVDSGSLSNVMAWYYDGQGQGTSSCVVPGEGP